MKISTLLEKLIMKKYYENKEDIENKLNVFYAMSKITDEEYSNLVLKVEEMYAVEVAEEGQAVDEATKTNEAIEEEV